MILVFFAIAFAALGTHEFMTRNDSANAALDAQAAKLSSAAAPSGAESSAAPATPAACVFAESGASADAKEAVAALEKAKVDVKGAPQPWRGRPSPKATTVYFGDGQEDAAKSAAAAFKPDAATAARPEGMDECAGGLVVVVAK